MTDQLASPRVAPPVPVLNQTVTVNVATPACGLPPLPPSGRLASEKVVIAAPMSFAGSGARLWKLTDVDNTTLKWLVLAPIAVVLIAAAWTIVAGWYLVFGLLLVPYRLVRRGSRKRKREDLQHRELLEAMGRRAR